MKILVVDDHALVREGLRQVLKGLAEQVEVLEAARCSVAFELAAANPDLDLVLLDLGLPDLNGLDALDHFGLRLADVPVIVLSGTDDPAPMRASFARGAAGFIPKSSLSEVLISALRLVLAGGTYVPSELLGDSPAAHPVRPGGSLAITDRQHDVLQLLVDGCSNKEIARRLDISEQTVKAHVTSILRALEVSSRARAAVAARRFGVSPRT
jgi:DNA-binding NarL/FixJ family response regulator